MHTCGWAGINRLTKFRNIGLHGGMKTWMRPKRVRKSVLLALGWYVHEMVSGVAKYARERDWILDDLPSHSGVVWPSWLGDGIITLIPDRQHQPLIDRVRRAGVPVVDLSDQLPELPFPRVLPDNEAIGRMAAEHLLGRGFSQLAFVTWDSAAPVVKGRLAGFQQTVAKADKAFFLLDYTPLMRKPGAVARFLPWLARRLTELPKPLGTMAQYDAEALNIFRACQLANLLVPEQVAVVGVDNDPIYCELGGIPLSSVASNREMIGYKGAELLDRLMQGDKAPIQPLRIAPTGLVIRKSSDIVAVDDVSVARALGFIAEHYREPITVQDVVAVSGSSRRNLYIKFADTIGHSIRGEILRQRLDRAKHLLRETGEKLVCIAQESGFEDPATLSKTFKQHLGISTTAFRALHRPSV